MHTIKIKHWDEIPYNFSGIAEYYDVVKEFYRNGKLHREDGPAVEFIKPESYEDHEWWLDGVSYSADIFCALNKESVHYGKILSYIFGNK